MTMAVVGIAAVGEAVVWPSAGGTFLPVSGRIALNAVHSVRRTRWWWRPAALKLVSLQPACRNC